MPKDSLLWLWLESLHVTENPVSYQVLAGLSAIGALLKRSIYVDQRKWRVYPNLSVLFIGPSGIGKDTIIGECEKLIHAVDGALQLNGDTIEYLKDELSKIAEPAAAYLPVKELTAFMGSKDYQKGIAQALTDLLSTNEKVVLGTKSEGRKVIIRPTITMHAGSTADWLRNLPEDSLGGGFLPRFVIICEDFPSRHVAWVKYDHSVMTTRAAEAAGAEFVEQVKALVSRFGGVVLRKNEREMTPTLGAEQYYRNWYANRFSYFSPNVQAYANRSRDQMHKLAMLMAVSRQHGYLEEVDYVFASAVMDCVASGLDNVVAPMLAASKRRRY